MAFLILAQQMFKAFRKICSKNIFLKLFKVGLIAALKRKRTATS
jgi:hypothetical protein